MKTNTILQDDSQVATRFQKNLSAVAHLSKLPVLGDFYLGGCMTEELRILLKVRDALQVLVDNGREQYQDDLDEVEAEIAAKEGI